MRPVRLGVRRRRPRRRLTHRPAKPVLVARPAPRWHAPARCGSTSTGGNRGGAGHGQTRVPGRDGRARGGDDARGAVVRPGRCRRPAGRRPAGRSRVPAGGGRRRPAGGRLGHLDRRAAPGRRRRGPGGVGGRPRPVVPAHRLRRARAGHGRHGLHGARDRPGPAPRQLVPLPVPHAHGHQPGRAAAHGAAAGAAPRPAAVRVLVLPADQRQPVRGASGDGRRGPRLLGPLRRLRLRPRHGDAHARRLPGRVPALQGQPAAAAPPRHLPGGGDVGRRRVRQRHGPELRAGALRRGRAGMVRAPAGAQQAARPHPHAPGDRVGRSGHVPAARHAPVPRRRHPRGAGPRRPAVHDGRHPDARGRADPRPGAHLPRGRAEALAHEPAHPVRAHLAPRRPRLQLPGAAARGPGHARDPGRPAARLPPQRGPLHRGRRLGQLRGRASRDPRRAGRGAGPQRGGDRRAHPHLVRRRAAARPRRPRGFAGRGARVRVRLADGRPRRPPHLPPRRAARPGRADHPLARGRRSWASTRTSTTSTRSTRATASSS